MAPTPVLPGRSARARGQAQKRGQAGCSGEASERRWLVQEGERGFRQLALVGVGWGTHPLPPARIPFSPRRAWTGCMHRCRPSCLRVSGQLSWKRSGATASWLRSTFCFPTPSCSFLAGWAGAGGQLNEAFWGLCSLWAGCAWEFPSLPPHSLLSFHPGDIYFTYLLSPSISLSVSSHIHSFIVMIF